MRSALLLLLIVYLLFLSIVNAQVKQPDIQSSSVCESRFYEQNILSEQDAFWLNSMPRLNPEHKSKNSVLLPYAVNNATLPFFRPIFSQGSYASCGQASGVSYNFTYEINRARNLPANIPQNQYPAHYHWNFTNGGYGWFGSSYFHSFEILRTNGSPTVEDYGGMDYGGGSRWMSGYEKYFNGMHHRIEGAYTIDVGTPEGLEILKHWLHNHLEGSETGGVASFYANSPYNYKPLPAGTPEAGKPVIADWAGLPVHAMTIVGYNDSIRYDYNSDGQFTNHLDINNDGIIDMRDWEIGGLLFANSYGASWAGNNGFAYMMYKTLADDVFNGGIWNHAAHVLKVKESYTPLLTARITLRHPARGKLKVLMGASADTTVHLPAQVLDFPIFNFQGGDVFLQGGNEEYHKTLEFGLDITPLLDITVNGQGARYFLQVIENDPSNLSDGEIVEFAIIDYSSGNPIEHVFAVSNVPIINDAVTTLGINAAVDFERVAILNQELPPISQDIPTVIQMEAIGGLEPYNWSIMQPCKEHHVAYSEPISPSTRENPFPGWNQWKSITLDFGFPFFDTVYNKITAYANGFILFTESPQPYPYWLDPMVLFRKYECIAPFIARNLILKAANNDMIWFEPSENQVRVNWKATYEYGDYQYPLQFSAVLFDDGRVEYHYKAFDLVDHCIWVAGISKGDYLNCYISEISGKQELSENKAIGFLPSPWAGKMHITKDGILSVQNTDSLSITDLVIYVSDSRSISDMKTLQITDAIIFGFEPDELALTAGSNPDIFVRLKNISVNPQNIESICFEAADNEFITWTNPCLGSIDLQPGEEASITLHQAFGIDPLAADKQLLRLKGKINLNGKIITRTADFTVRKVSLGFTRIGFDENLPGGLVAGNKYSLTIGVANFGDAAAHNVKIRVSNSDPYLILYPPFVFEVGSLGPNQGFEAATQLGIHPNTPPGYSFTVVIELFDDEKTGVVYEMKLYAGKVGIAVVDLDPGLSSANLIHDAIKQNEFASDIVRFINNDLADYDLLFVCLGSFPNRHQITDTESTTLVNYLLNGGKIYMEGGSTWRGDPRKPVHDMFQIQGLMNGWPYTIDSLTGTAGTFTENFRFSYYPQTIKNDNMAPMGEDAFVLFSDVARGLHYSIACENESYKTIGTSFKFNGIYHSPSDQEPVLLMKEYLDFFGFSANTLTANFTAGKYMVCENEPVQFHLKTAGDVQSVYWEFEGGTPPNSTEFSPEVTYALNGKYAVRLLVSDGVTYDTLTLDDIITVQLCSGIRTPQTTSLTVYPNPANQQIIVKSHEIWGFDTGIQIFDSNGRLVIEKTVPDFGTANPLIIDVSGLRNGIYFIRVAGSKENYSTKLLIIR